MNVLQTKNLTKTYHKNTVVDHVNMTVEEGDIYGFVGENGAGKTTIIRMLTGLARPTKGSFELFGVKHNDKQLSEVKRQLSAVVEAPSVYLNMNAMDNLRAQCRMLGCTEEGAENYLALVGLERLVHDKKKAKNFSLGMRQRLGIAMALVGSPKLVILDEPMNGLDPMGIIEMRELILKLNQEGVTFIISSHILEELSKIATRYGIISHGKLVRELTAEELMKEIRHSVVYTCSDAKVLKKVVHKLAPEAECILHDEKTLEVFAELSISELSLAAGKEAVTIETAATNSGSIEEFYIKTIGGVSHA